MNYSQIDALSNAVFHVVMHPLSLILPAWLHRMLELDMNSECQIQPSRFSR